MAEKIFKRIIVPIDGSEHSKKAAKKAFSIANDTNLKVTLMHVYQIPAAAFPPAEATVYSPEISKRMLKSGEDMLNEFKKIGSEMDVDIKTKLIEGVPDDVIIKEAEKDDLIVMGSKGHSTIARILIGSVSEKVLHHSDATVMIVR